MEPIRYDPDSAKIASAIVRIIESKGETTVSGLAWILHRAEYIHINLYGRPVLGLDYGEDGGLPKCRQLATVIGDGDGYGSITDADIMRITRRFPASDERLSVSDRDALDTAAGEYMSLDEAGRLAAMPPGWNAGSEEWFGYENMLAAQDEEVVLDIASTAPYAVF